MAAVMWLQQMAAGRRRAGGGSGGNTSWVRPAQDGPLTLPLPPPAPFPPLQSCRRSGTPRRSGMCRHGTLTPTRIPWWVLRRGAVGCCWELWVRVGSACRRHRQLHLAHRCRLPCRERGSAGLWPLQSRRFKPWRHLSRLPSIPLGCKPHPAAIPCPPVLPCPALPFR